MGVVRHTQGKPDGYLGYKRVSLGKQQWTKADDKEECSCVTM